MNSNDRPQKSPSKSQLKRESLALQKLGERLITMPEALFLAVPMPDELRAAVSEARAMKSRRALYRQRQFIGKLMREIDASGEPRFFSRQPGVRAPPARPLGQFRASVWRCTGAAGKAPDEFSLRAPRCPRA